MKISEAKIKQMIKESINEHMVREGVAWKKGGLKQFEFPHCDLSQFDPTFMKVLNLFKTDGASAKNYEDNSFIENLANAMGSERDFINPTMIKSFNELLLPGIEMLGKFPVGGIAICKLLTKLSNSYSNILKQASSGYSGGDNLDYMKNSDKTDMSQKQQYYLNGLINDTNFKRIVQVRTSGGVVQKKIFQHSVSELAVKINESNINGLDAVLFQMFIPNTINTGKKDITELSEYQSFAREFRNELSRATTIDSIITIFSKSFNATIRADDNEYVGVTTSGTIKNVRKDIFVQYLKNDIANINSIFKSPNEFSNSIISGLNRISKFTK